MDTDRLAVLSGAGVSIWLEDLSRDRLRAGELGDLIENQYVVGFTSNPTIFATAITGDWRSTPGWLTTTAPPFRTLCDCTVP